MPRYIGVFGDNTGQWVQDLSDLSPTYLLEEPDESAAVHFVKAHLLRQHQTLWYLGRVACGLDITKVDGMHDIAPRNVVTNRADVDGVHCERLSCGLALLGQLCVENVAQV